MKNLLLPRTTSHIRRLRADRNGSARRLRGNDAMQRLKLRALPFKPKFIIRGNFTGSYPFRGRGVPYPSSGYGPPSRGMNKTSTLKRVPPLSHSGVLTISYGFRHVRRLEISTNHRKLPLAVDLPDFPGLIGNSSSAQSRRTVVDASNYRISSRTASSRYFLCAFSVIRSAFSPMKLSMSLIS